MKGKALRKHSLHKKTQVEFDLGNNPLKFDGVNGLLKKHSTLSGCIRVLWTHF